MRPCERRSLQPQRPIVAATLACLMAIGGSSCGEKNACTLVGCSDSLSIRIESEHWPPGGYSIRVMASSFEVVCDFDQLEPGSNAGGASGAAGAEGDPAALGSGGSGGSSNATEYPVASRIRGANCTQTLGSGSPFPPSLSVGRDVVVSIEAALKTFTVVVTHDEREAHREHVRPHYVKVYPNGPDCGSGCKRAEVNVQVTAL